MEIESQLIFHNFFPNTCADAIRGVEMDIILNLTYEPLDYMVILCVCYQAFNSDQPLFACAVI